MHELSLVVDLIEECCSRAAGREVTEVRARCHEGTDADEIRDAFGFLTSSHQERWASLQGAELKVEQLAAHLDCPCGHSGALGPEDVAGHIGVCPSCGRTSELGTSLELVGLVFAGGTTGG